MKYLSLFSGIEAFSVAVKDMNWKPVAFSEIADFPSAVLQFHYPDIPNLGDIKNINGEKCRGTVDIVVGGSPCQDFSISGKRAGLHGERSRLAREYIRILAEIQPKWFIWENVPGCLSTNRGNDFRMLLVEMEQLGYGLAWRILDSQYFGVPQRRRRIFLVGYFGDWRPSVAVLFDSKSLSGDIKKSNKKQSKIAKNIRINTFPTMLENVCPTILANSGSKQFLGNQEAFSGKYFVFDCMHSGSVRIYNDTCPTLLSRMGTGGNQTPITFCSQNSIKIQQSSIGSISLALRKLTPIECERLQGFPDNYTNIPYKGKQHSPLSKRYEAIGNSMAVPVVKWICERIEKVSSYLRI